MFMKWQVYAFDPSMEKKDHDHSANIHFYAIGIGSEDTNDDVSRGWKLRTLKSLYEMLKPRHGAVPIDFLKLDVEQAEWAAVPHIIESGMLDHIKQLALEIHFFNNVPLVDYVRVCLKVVQSLERHGMVRFSSRANRNSEGILMGKPNLLAYELVWYNSKFLP